MSETREQTEQERAIEQLREMFPPGSTARTILRHVSSSGMTRWISVVSPDAEDVSWVVARAIGERCNVGKHEGIKVGGCGMDMGFALVYRMSHTIYPDGFGCIGGWGPGEHSANRCPSNDHVNTGNKNNTWHRWGGYAVSQRWL